MSKIKRQHGTGTTNLSHLEQLLEGCRFLDILSDKEIRAIEEAMTQQKVNSERTSVSIDKRQIAGENAIVCTITYTRIIADEWSA